VTAWTIRVPRSLAYRPSATLSEKGPFRLPEAHYVSGSAPFSSVYPFRRVPDKEASLDLHTPIKKSR